MCPKDPKQEMKTADAGMANAIKRTRTKFTLIVHGEDEGSVHLPNGKSLTLKDGKAEIEEADCEYLTDTTRFKIKREVVEE